jgi:hypothetical protein
MKFTEVDTKHSAISEMQMVVNKPIVGRMRCVWCSSFLFFTAGLEGSVAPWLHCAIDVYAGDYSPGNRECVCISPTKFSANDHCRYILQCVWAYGIPRELKWYLVMVGIARGLCTRHYDASIKYSPLQTSESRLFN